MQEFMVDICILIDIVTEDLNMYCSAWMFLAQPGDQNSHLGDLTS